MTPIIEDAVLGSDLNAASYNLLNVKSLDPVPSNLATSDDVRLSNDRPPLPGSVSNISVANDAGIDQIKLNLNGQIPTAWLGTSPGTAAEGSLAEYVANKNQPNGYAGLDSTGKLPSSRLPDSVGLATVTSVGLDMPPEFTIAGPNPITGSGIWTVNWVDVGGAVWFGSMAGETPAFQTAALPPILIPNLNTSRVTSGVFNTARLPVMIGVGPTSAPGMVPDPGPLTGGAAVTDYLSREGDWKPAPVVAVGYQPGLPPPTLTVTDTPPGGPRTVAPGYDPTLPANDAFQDATFFYAFTLTGVTVAPTSGFAEFPPLEYVEVAATDKIWVYAAHPGFNNSTIVHQP